MQKSMILIAILLVALSAQANECQKSMTDEAVLSLVNADMANKAFRHGIDGDELLGIHFPIVRQSFKDGNLHRLQIVFYKGDYSAPERIYEYVFQYGRFQTKEGKVDAPSMENADRFVRSLPRIFNMKCLVVYYMPADCLARYGLSRLDKKIGTGHMGKGNFDNLITSPFSKVDSTVYYTVDRVQQ